MSNNNCILKVEVTTPKGVVEASRLFKDLVDKDKFHYKRDIAVLLYCTYLIKLEPEMESIKDSEGHPKYIKNRQGQFNAKDVVEYSKFNKNFEEINNLEDEEIRLGAVDHKGGNRIDYTNAEEVLRKIDEFNDSHKGLVADMKKYSASDETVYNIRVYEKNSRTIGIPALVKEKLKVWETYKQAFNAVGVDITSVPKELSDVFTPDNMNLDFLLQGISQANSDRLFKKDILTLYYIDADSEPVKRVINSFGSIEDAAQALSDRNQGNIYITEEQNHLLNMAINHAKKLHGLDIDALKAQVDTLQKTIRNSDPERELKEKIHELNKKYNLDRIDINDLNTKIKTLSDINKTAIVNLKRRITKIKKAQGDTTEGRNLTQLYNKMKSELNGRYSCNGIIDYLKLAGKDISSIDTLLESIPQDGEAVSRILKTAGIYSQIKNILNQYEDIITKIASDRIDVDEPITKENMESLKSQAIDLKKFIDARSNTIEELTENLVKDCLRTASNGKLSESDINDAIQKGIKNVGWLDRLLYGADKSNNIILAVAGHIMRNADTNRTTKLVEFEKKINKATYKLFKAGYDTEFMYEDEQHIASNIDWKKYEAAKKGKENSLRKRGLRDFDLQIAMDEWINENTVEKVVDKINKRTEKIPDKKYWKEGDFQEGWTPEQKEYYDTVMEYKGEIESLYPVYAQNYYYPPQIRRNMVDAISHSGITKDVKSGTKNILKAVGNKISDLFVVREDDTNYAENGIVDGKEVKFAQGAYDNTIKKEIPIYFQTNVSKGELLLDFSAAMLRHASSAFTYSAMNEIKDTLEAISDYVDSKQAMPPKDTYEDIVDNKMVRMTRALYAWANKNNVSAVLHGFIDQHIYGIKRNPNENKRLSKFVDSLIWYTSFKGLTANLPGATSNFFGGINQIFIDTIGGEFFNGKDIWKGSLRMFGTKGMIGDMTEWLSDNINSKTGLLIKEFDPIQENYQNISNKRYHNNIVRKILSKDLRFMLYEKGEYLIHLLPMYAILEHQKVKLNGKTISLYEAYDVTEKEEGNRELKIKEGVTDMEGNPITKDYIHKIKDIIKEANQSMHGAMSPEDRGLIHQYMLGRLAINFKQWMIAHYSRRFRGNHFDFSLKEWREGYYTTFFKELISDDVKDAWTAKQKKEALKILSQNFGVFMFSKDLMSFIFKSATQWDNLTPMQKHNIRRARAEVLMLIMLTCLSFALGEPDEHKKEFWRRFFIYQTKRMITETEAAMPSPGAVNSAITIFQSPMAGINTLNSMMYALYGLTNGDISEEIKSGPHKGENVYWRNFIKYDLPFFKDWERLATMDEDDSVFKVFEYSPSNH